MPAEATINSMLVDDGSTTFYSAAFRTVLEDHMTYLRNHPDTVMVSVTPMQAYVYEFDATGLLLELSIPLNLHWPVIRMNNLSSHTQVPSDLLQLLVPSAKEITRIKQTFESQRQTS